MIPSISATKFFSKMRAIDGWETMPLAVVAQRVQVSAFPDAYAKHEPLATAIVNAITDGTLTCTAPGSPSASGWIKPVNGTFTSGYRTPDRPTHNGVDVAAPKGTPSTPPAPAPSSPPPAKSPAAMSTAQSLPLDAVGSSRSNTPTTPPPATATCSDNRLSPKANPSTPANKSASSAPAATPPDPTLLRLAHRNGTPLLRLAPVLGFGDRLRVPHNYALSWRLPPQLLRRVESQTGLAPGALDATVLDRFEALGWKPIPGSRYCSRCLAESGGVWEVRWQLPYTFACLRHHTLLAAVCPGCQRPPQGAGLSLRAGLLPSTRCTLGARRETRPCDADLLTHPPQPLRSGDLRLAAQAWIDERLTRMGVHDVVELRDLDALALWFRHRVEPAELRQLGEATVTAMIEYRADNHGIKRDQATAPFIAAVMSVHAIGLLRADDQQRYRWFRPLLRDVHTQYRRGQSPSSRGPMILSHKRLGSVSEPLQRKLLISADPHLPVSERLRYRTCTPTPRPPEPQSTTAADRARHIPQCLWPEWVIRLGPRHGSRTDDTAVDIPAALLIPGNPVRNVHATGEINPWRNNTSIALSEAAARHPDILTTICTIADYLDTHGSPIDYRRRRATFTNVVLSQQQWDDICQRAEAHPGTGTRHLHARRYLFQLLTGADLGNPVHPLAFRTSLQREHYLSWQRDMPSPLRREVRHHAAGLLAVAGIDEPLTWSPPAECVAGLDLPGREPDDIDTDRLHLLVVVDGLKPKAAARQLGVSIEHVRYAVENLHRPAPEYASNNPVTARKVRARAAALLTRDFFQRENVDAGKDITTLIAETGFSRTILNEYAKRAGFTFVRTKAGERIRIPRARNGDPVDRAWLREQAGTLFRANDDIGAELGLRGETIRRYRRDYEIPGRASGSDGHVVTNLHHPNLPRDIRRAVEGQRNGWQRLHRFQQIMAHRSMNTAAATLGLHSQNLNLQIQRLEADIGAPILQRAPHRYAPMAPTHRGQRLLDHLARPDIRELLHRYSDANARPKCGPYRRSAQH